MNLADGEEFQQEALQLYPDGSAPSCGTLEDCLRRAVPAHVCNGLFRDMPAINGKYRDTSTQALFRTHGLSEVEAKCIIMFTYESRAVPDHPRPLDASSTISSTSCSTRRAGNVIVLRCNGFKISRFTSYPR